MAQKLIIDADPGITDAVAIAIALFDPEIDVMAITATSGTVGGRLATRNIQAIVEQLDPPRLPRIGASDVGRSRDAFSLLNGPDGLGDCRFNIAELHHVHESAKLMIDIVRGQPNEISLLTLGPLTNVEMACERAPNFLGLLKGLVCLGGSVTSGGDVTPAAEFNIYADPQAARTVLRSPATKTLVPLDISGSVVLTFEKFSRLQADNANSVSRLMGCLLPYAFRAHHEHLGREGVGLHALVALAAIARPALFRSEPMAIDIETVGELTRGMTVFDRRDIDRWQTNIFVVRQVESQGVLDYFSEIFCR